METTDQDRKDAAFLTEGALKLIGQILVKHQAAVLSEFRVLHADLQSRDATIEGLRAELAEAKRDGWVLVPVEPTEEMNERGRVLAYTAKQFNTGQIDVNAIYKAMIAAALAARQGG